MVINNDKRTKMLIHIQCGRTNPQQRHCPTQIKTIRNPTNEKRSRPMAKH